MIQMQKESIYSINSDMLDLILLKANSITQYRKYMYDRYRRKVADTDIMGGVSAKSVIAPFEYYIVNMIAGYMGGKSPLYKILSDDIDYTTEFSDKLDYIQRYNDDAATFTELIKDYSITAAAYLYIYEDEDNELRYARFDSKQTIAVYDYSTPVNLIAVFRTWTESDMEKDNIICEWITDKSRQVYKDKKLISEEPLHWGFVPCAAFENPDNISVFEPALTSIDSFEQIKNNIRNTTRYNDEAKLLISGYAPQSAIGSPERSEEEQRWLKAPTLYIETGGEGKWLIKDINYDGSLNVLKTDHELITMLTGVPNLTDEAFSNADNASALGYKLYALDQYCATIDRIFKKGYLFLWEIITNRLNLKGGNYDFRDIDIIMQRNIPTDKDKSIDRATTMKQSGLFSDETCINESQIEVDAKDEMARRDAENDVELDRILKPADNVEVELYDNENK